MKTHIILEGTPLNKTNTFKKIFTDVESIGKEAGIPIEGISKIKHIVTSVIGKKNSKNFIDAANVAEKDDADDADDIDESVSTFNKIYKQLVLEAEKTAEKTAEVESDTDATGKVYWLVVKNGKGYIQTKDGLFDSNLNDDALSEFIKKVKEEPKAFQEGTTVRLGSVADTKEDTKSVVDMLSKENIAAAEAPELSDVDGFSVSDTLADLAKEQTDAVSNKLTKDKKLRKILLSAKIDDESAVSNFIFGTICAAIFAQGIRANKAKTKKDSDKAASDKVAIKNIFEGFSPYDDIVIPGFNKGHRGLKLANTISLVDTKGKEFNLTCPGEKEIKSDEDLDLLAHTLAQGTDGKRDVDPASYIKALETIKATVKPALGWAHHSAEQKQNLTACLTKCDELMDKLQPLVKK